MDEELKEKLLAELQKEYVVTLKPIKEKSFTVADILEKYYEDICNKINVPKTCRYTETIGNCIRRILCLHYGVFVTKDIPVEQRESFRADLEKFITEFILGGN